MFQPKKKFPPSSSTSSSSASASSSSSNPSSNNTLVFLCEICGKEDDTDETGQAIICGNGIVGCDKRYHQNCLQPKLVKIPKGDWFCLTCSGQSNVIVCDTCENEYLLNDIGITLNEAHALNEWSCGICLGTHVGAKSASKSSSSATLSSKKQTSSQFGWQISQHRNMIHVVYNFETEEDAAIAWDKAAIKYRGRETKTNFPITNYTSYLAELDAETKKEVAMKEAAKIASTNPEASSSSSSSSSFSSSLSSFSSSSSSSSSLPNKRKREREQDNCMVHNLDVEPKRKKRQVDPRNTSGFTGVSKSGSKFRIAVSANGKRKFIGGFVTAIDAALAYDQAIKGSKTSIGGGRPVSTTLNYPKPPIKLPWFNDVDGYFFQHTFQTPRLLGMTLNLVRTSHSHPGSFILVEGLSNNSAATISSPNSPAILPGDILMEVSNDGNGLWKQKDCLVEGNMHDLTMYMGRRPLVLLFWRDAPNSSGSDGSELVQAIANEKQQKEAQDKEMKETAAQAKEDLTHATNTTTLAKQSSSLSTSLSTSLSSSLSSSSSSSSLSSSSAGLNQQLFNRAIVSAHRSSSSSSSSSPTTTTTTKGQCVSTEGKLYGPFIHAYPIEQPNAAYPAPPPHSQLSYLQFAELQRNTNGQRCGFSTK